MVITASNDLLNAWPEGEVRLLPLPLLSESYRRYRLPDAAAEAAMAGALTRYGQLSPLAVFIKDDAIEVLDGFKRLAAARSISGFSVADSAAPSPSSRPRNWRLAGRLLVAKVACFLTAADIATLPPPVE